MSRPIKTTTLIRRTSRWLNNTPYILALISGGGGSFDRGLVRRIIRKPTCFALDKIEVERLMLSFLRVASRRGIFGTVGTPFAYLQRQVNHMTCLQISNGPFRQSLFLETIQVGG